MKMRTQEEAMLNRNWRAIAHPLPCTLFFIILFVSVPLCGQTIYDMGEINGDLRVIGAERHDLLKHLSFIDLDASGHPDLILSVRGAGLGRMEVFLDRSMDYFINTMDLRFQEPDIAINGGVEGSYTIHVGDTLISGDFNNDGLEDFVTSDFRRNRVFVFFGSPDWYPGTTINIPDDPADLTIIKDISYSLDFGYHIEFGDINNDGIDDLVIGEQHAINGVESPGAVNVIYGREDFTLYEVIDLNETPADLTIYGAEHNDEFGWSVATGDLNGDGIDDILAGSEWASDSDGCGRIYAIFGSNEFPPQHVIDLATEPADIEIKGLHENSRPAWEVDVCDLNCDGIGDLCFAVVWLETDPQYRGAVFVVNGRDDFPQQHYIDLAMEQPDLKIIGEVGDSYLGNALMSGDLDNDGCEDLAVTGYRCRERLEDEGVVYVFSGSAQYPNELTIDLFNNDPELKVLGISPYDGLRHLSEMADLNQDGRLDLVTSAFLADRDDDPDAEECGEIYVILSDGTLFNPPRYLASPGFHPVNPAELRLYDPFDHEGWTGRYSPYLVDGYGLVSAAGDLDGDGYDEMITGPGPGPYHPALVMVLHHTGERLASFSAYGTPRYGVLVSTGDLDGDGIDEIVTGAGPGAVYGPHVRGWRWDGEETVSPMAGVSFLAYGTHRWGVNVACGDIDGDGRDEIITGAGPGAVFGPHVRGWDADGGTALPIPAVSYFAYGTPRWGVNVACGDIDADGIAEIVTGPGPGEIFSSHVRGWNYDGEVLESMPGVNFIAYQSFPHSTGCVVACGDADNDRVAEILTGPGPHTENQAYVKTWNYDGVELTLVPEKSFLVFESGNYVAGARIALGNPYQHPDYLP